MQGKLTILTNTKDEPVFPITSSQAVKMPDGDVNLDESLEQIAINVKLYGAKGDGETDDSLALSNADIKNGTLLFPNGVYKTSYIPKNKCKGNGAVLVINGYKIKLCDIALNVNSKWQEYIRMNNTVLGLDCGINMDTVNAYGNVALGHNAMRDNVSSVRNTAIGNNSQMEMTDGYGNTSIGVDSLHHSKFSDRNTMVGSTCGKNIGNIKPNETNGLFNGAVDTVQDYDSYWGEWRTYAGNIGGCNYIPTNGTQTTSNVGVGRNALGFAQTPTRCVAIGYNSLEGGINANNMVSIGESCLQYGIKSENGVFIGGRCGYHNMDNNQDVVIGKSAMENTIHSDKNVAIGYQTMLGKQSNVDAKPLSNVSIGRLSLANYQGDISYNVGVGEQSLLNNQGNGNVGIGYGALAKNTTGGNNTSLGFNSGNRVGTETLSNTTSIGANAFCNGSNQIQLGDSNTNTYVYGTVQTRSDVRDKTDIEDTKLGLEFIKKLRPVDYKYDYREDYNVYNENGELIKKLKKDGSKKRTRKHHGLIAQEVKEVCDELNIDFGGYQDHLINGGGDIKTIGYEELIAPLIKAIQELNKKIEDLENK